MNASVSASKNTLSRRWLRVIPPLLIACIISYMDRVNIAFALPGGMMGELGMAEKMAGIASGIFFFGYLFLQIPGGKLAALGNGKKFIALSLVAWTIISALTGLVSELWQLLVLRFLLGVAEGGMLPVVLTMASNWFADHERGRANALIIMFVPLAGMITAPLSGLIIEAYGWRELFYASALISFLFLFIWQWLADDSPQTARWISQAEKTEILEQLRQEEERKQQAQTPIETSLKSVVQSPIIWLMIVVNFCYQTGIYGYTMWLPSLIKNLTGQSMNQVGFLTMVPYIAMIVGMLGTSYLSDKTGKRRLFVLLPLTGFALCLALSVFTHSNAVVSFAFLVGCGFFMQAAAGIFWAILPKLCSAESAGGARGLVNALGNLGGFVGPYAVGFITEYHSSSVAIYSLAVMVGVAGLLSLTLPKRCEH